ncbi:hypothetical protein Plhal710r2_c029g0108361 [Plasmopara halstedii]
MAVDTLTAMTNNNPSCRRLVEILCPEIVTGESAQASGLPEVGLVDAAVRQEWTRRKAQPLLWMLHSAPRQTSVAQ